tara:strand:- start:227 stop:490 length:264 start_codon:yes stop_codon:yes gene_type:complete
MLKEIKYFIFFLVIIFFIIFSIKYYISDENKKKTFRNLNLIDKNISLYKNKLPTISNDTNNIVKHLNNDESTNKKKYSFWNLLKNEN